MANNGILRSLIAIYPLAVVVIITLLARLYTRARILRQLGIDDYLVTASVVVGVAVLAVNIRLSYMVHWLNQNLLDERVIFFVAPIVRERLTQALALAFSASLLYPLQLGLIKLSILFFYRRFMALQKGRWILYAIGVFIILYSIAIYLALFLGCRPFSGHWNVLLENRVCPVHPFRLQLANSICNLISDILILAVPIPLVSKLQADTRKKVGLAFVFVLGVGGTVATIVRLAKVAPHTRGPVGNAIGSVNVASGIIFWSQMELVLATICANLPALAALWRTTRNRNKSQRSRSTGCTAPTGLAYQLGSRKERDPMPDKNSDPDNSSEEHIVPKGQGIVRSTHIVVENDLEHAR